MSVDVSPTVRHELDLQVRLALLDLTAAQAAQDDEGATFATGRLLDLAELDALISDDVQLPPS